MLLEGGEPYVDVVADTSIEVGHSEEIASTPYHGRRGGMAILSHSSIVSLFPRPRSSSQSSSGEVHRTEKKRSDHGDDPAAGWTG